MLRKKIDILFDEKSRNNLIKKLAKNAEIQKGLTNQMWEHVYSIIDSSMVKS